MNLVYLFTASPGTNFEKKYYFDLNTLLGKKTQVSVTAIPVEKYNETYHPARVTYVGITIGGVHTGTLNVQDAYFSLGKTRTAKGKVEIDNISVEAIQLSDQLLQIVKEDPILKNEISGNTLRLKGEGRRASEAEMLNMLRGNDVPGSTAYLNSQADACYPMEFCARAAEFIANALDGTFLTDRQRKEAALSLLNQKNPEYWYLAKTYFEKHIDDDKDAIEIIKKIDEELSLHKKYEIDGKVFYDEQEYNKYVWDKEYKKKETKATILGLICALFIGACGLVVLFALGII